LSVLMQIYSFRNPLTAKDAKKLRKERKGKIRIQDKIL
jgi:hypothetical protein